MFPFNQQLLIYNFGAGFGSTSNSYIDTNWENKKLKFEELAKPISCFVSKEVV